MESQLFHNKLENINNIGLKITWKFILIGYKGYMHLNSQITKDDICKYIENHINEKDNGKYIELLVNEHDDYAFEKTLRNFANKEYSDLNLQIDKWILYLTKVMIDNLKSDYYENLLEINDFWVSLGQPEYCPHIFQGVNNEIEPEDYYTIEMYDKILKIHKEWIKKEIKRINLLEK